MAQRRRKVTIAISTTTNAAFKGSSAVRVHLSTGLAAAFATTVLLGRFALTGETTYAFLTWNLFLAIIPVFIGELLVSLSRRNNVPGALAAFFTWLVFFPNAPYLVTDFVHLRLKTGAPVIYDIGLLAAFAFAGGICAFVSLARVEGVVRERYGTRLAWATVLGCAALSGVGIYLGRFERWNTWDLVTSPFAIVAGAARVLDPIGNPQAAGSSALFAGFIAVAYTCLRVLGVGHHAVASAQRSTTSSA
jgi:uncharacterized membrane protein